MLDAFLLAKHTRWASRNGYWALAALSGLLLFIPPGFLPSAVAFFTLLSWLLAAVVVLGLPGLVQDSFPRYWGWIFVAYLASLIWSVISSSDPAVSFNAYLQELSLWLVFLLASLLARSALGMRKALTGLWLVALILSLYGLYQWFYGLNDTYQQIFSDHAPQSVYELEIAQRLLSGRAFSLFPYPNLFAGFLVMVGPVGWMLMQTAGSYKQRFFWGIGNIIVLIALYATGSIGGWLAGILGGLVYWAIWRRAFPGQANAWTKRLWILGLVIALVGLTMLWLQRGPNTWVADLSRRWENWSSVLRLVWDHLGWGVGPGLFGSYFADYQTPGGYYIRFAHNVFLQRLAETGVVGWLLFLCLLAVIAWQMKQEWHVTMSPLAKSLVIGLGAGLVAGFVHANVDLDLDFFKTRLIFYLWLGSAFGLLSREARPRPHPVGLSIRELRLPAEAMVRWGLSLLLVLVLWKGGKSLPVEGLLIVGASGLLGLFFMGQAFSSAEPLSWVRQIPLRLSLGLLLIWGLFSSLVSDHPAGALPGWGLAIAAGLVYILAILVPRTEIFIMRSLSLSSVGLAAAALIEALLHPGTRITIGWPNPNLLAAFFSMGLLLHLVPLSLGLTKAWWQGRSILSLALLFPALLATGSFAGLCNFFTGFLVLGIWIWRFHPQQIKKWVLLFLVMASLVMVLPFTASQRLKQMDHYQGSSYERIQLAWAAGRMAWDRPFAGFGPGNFALAFEQYQFPNIRGLSRYGKQALFAHNEILHWMAVAGITGGLLLIWLFFMLFWYFSQQWRQYVRGRIPDKFIGFNLRLTAWILLAGAGAQAWVDFNWHLPALLVWGLALLGVALKSPPPQNRTGKSLPHPQDKNWFYFWQQGLQKPWALLLGLVLLIMSLTAMRPLVSNYFLHLGEAYYFKKDLKPAERSLEQALNLHPFSSQAYDHLGQVAADFYGAAGTENWFQLAEWAFTKALKLNRLNAFVHRHWAVLHQLKAARIKENPEKAKEYDQALQQYHLAIAKAPYHAPLFFELGNLLRDSGSTSAAIRAWQAALVLEPNYAAAWSNLGVAQEMENQWQEAETSFRKALAIQPLSTQAQGQYEIELLTLNWAVVHYNLANLLERKGRLIESKQEYQSVLDLEPSNPLALEHWRALEKVK